ncbi:MAG: hypothetical protein P1V20_06815 [Verrucomicrobiales bacterium]|nr:hypothetical protein [Verrucomicrobiales bacterium]
MPNEPANEKKLIILPGEGTGAGTDLLDALIHHFSDGEATISDLDPKLIKELREELERSPFFSQDMKNLWLMLEKALTKTGRNPGIDDQIRLLNLACGHCEEGSILPAFFGKGGKRVRQFAMDLRDREIDKARRRYNMTENLFRKAGIPRVREKDERNTVEFVADDATHLVGYGQVPARFDVIFIRHQNLWHDREVWKKIYEFVINRLEPDNGVLFITSYFDREHILALELLKTLGGNVLFTEQNPHTRELDYPGKTVDRHVAAIVQS